MPLFRFRLEAQDGSGHFRQGAISEPTIEKARATLEQREAEYVGFSLDPVIDPDTGDVLVEGQVGELEAEHGSDIIQEALAAPKTAKMPAGLPPAVRGKLALHRQQKPYKLVSLEPVGE